MAKFVRIIPANIDLTPYYLPITRAEQLMARGLLKRRGFVYVETQAKHGSARHWSKVQRRTGLGGPEYATMQLVYGVDQGKRSRGCGKV